MPLLMDCEHGRISHCSVERVGKCGNLQPLLLDQVWVCHAATYRTRGPGGTTATSNWVSLVRKSRDAFGWSLFAVLSCAIFSGKIQGGIPFGIPLGIPLGISLGINPPGLGETRRAWVRLGKTRLDWRGLGQTGLDSARRVETPLDSARLVETPRDWDRLGEPPLDWA